MEGQRKDIMWRAYAIYFLMLIAGISVLARAYYISFAEGETWRAKLEANTVRLRTIEATRGNICGSDGRLLAISVPFFDIRVDVASPNISDELFNDQIDELCTNLSGLFNDQPASYYKQNLRRERRAGNRYYLLKRNVNYDQLKALQGFPLFELGMHGGGLIVEKKDRRVMPFSDLARRTIGYQRNGYYVGLEGAYSDYLQGTNGQRLERRIASGYWVPVNEKNLVDPQNGKDIITSIDINVQDVAETALRTHLARNNATYGCVVLMEVSTGQIRAIANLTRDSATGEYHEDYNYAVGGLYEPGSTFKLASMIANLEGKKVSLADTVNTTGGIVRIGRSTMRDSHEGGYGRISVRSAFEVSSNVGILKVTNKAWSSEPAKFIAQLRKMGLGSPLGIEIKGEGKPYLKDPDDASWSATSLPWISVGYEMTITPLQLLTFYNAVANDGRMVKPQFVREIREAGVVVKRFETEVLVESIASARTIVQAQELLEGVVLRGTARGLMNAPMKIAGKTGTAQIYSPAGYAEADYHASFVGYFPADDPKYSCIVVARAPRGGPYYGSQVAAPVFLEVAEKVYSSEIGLRKVETDTSLHNTYRNSNTMLAGPGSRVVAGLSSAEHVKVMSEAISIQGEDNEYRVEEVHYPANQVPDVRGLGLRSAMMILESRGIRVRVVGSGHVNRQSINPGTALRRGMTISIYLN